MKKITSRLKLLAAKLAAPPWAARKIGYTPHNGAKQKAKWAKL